MTNEKIREKIADAGLRYWQVAYAAGISEATLCVWLRKPLTEEREKRIMSAIEVLSSERREGAAL